MEQYIITGVTCFVLGSVVGTIGAIVMLALCRMAKEEDHKMGIADSCNGCFGAANGDCNNCEKTQEKM